MRPADLDATGRLDLSALILHASDANVQFQNRVGMTSSYMRAEKIGYATFAYRVTLHDLPREPGAVLKTDSAVARGRAFVAVVRASGERRADRRGDRGCGAVRRAFRPAGACFSPHSGAYPRAGATTDGGLIRCRADGRGSIRRAVIGFLACRVVAGERRDNTIDEE